MSIVADYVVVGAGLTGATIARLLADAGREVVVLERRGHLGGNVHDYEHPSGIRVHTYGPHYFRTNSEKIWAFVNRFAPFWRYEAVVRSWVDGRYECWPVTEEYINRTVGQGWKPCFRGRPTNFEEACLRIMPPVVYEKFVRGYTEKQWGVAASSLAASLAGRFEVRSNGDVRLKTHRFQGLPMAGYAQFMEAMLGGIPVFLHFDYLRCRSEVAARKLLVYTGPIDEFFSYDLGRLRYRCQRRETHYLPDVQRFQPVGQVNYPSFADGPHIRILEWTHMAPPGKQAVVSGTVITVEVPTDASRPDEYEYPFPDELNRQLYERYAERARALNNVLFCGRLGEYRYYDMDQAIARAMQYALKILGSPAARDGVR